LGNIDAFRDWIARTNPPRDVRYAVHDWLVELGATPWLAPSIPIPELSGQPEWEVREAVVPGPGGVAVTYVHFYVAGVTDLLQVRAVGVE
jgi:hypothetical protein